MNTTLRTWVIVIAFLLLGCATRFYRLDWSVAGDHTSTFKEVVVEHMVSGFSGPMGYIITGSEVLP